MVTEPGFFYRHDRRQRLFQNRFGAAEFFILDHPKLRPAIDGRQLPRGTNQIEIFGYALDTEGGENVSQMADHQRVFGAENFFHLDFTR